MKTSPLGGVFSFRLRRITVRTRDPISCDRKRLLVSTLLGRSSAIVALAALLGAAQQPVTGVAPAGAGDVTRATLGNGLRVVIVRDPLAPVATVYDNYLVGANETPAGFPGMAHAQEHMAFRGCTDVSADQTAAIFAQLGGEDNADTQQNVTQYFTSVANTQLPVALAVDAACMRHIDDAQDQWALERGAIEQEVAADNSNPTYKAFARLTADMFAGTPYAHDALGTRESFDKTTGALLGKFATDWYAPNNAILVIAGDVDSKATLATVERLYGSIPSRTIAKHPAIDLQPVKSESFSIDSDLPYGLALIGYRLPGSDDPDYAASQILGDVLASQRGDLYALVPANKALEATFQYAAQNTKASLGIVVGVVPVNASLPAIDATLASTVAKTLADGVPPDLVDAAKRSEIAQAEYARNSIGDLASSWAEALASEGRTSPDDDIAALAKVTVADVDAVARKYLRPELAVTANLASKPSGKAVTSKTFGGGESLTSAPNKPVVLPDFAKSILGPVVVPKSTLAPTDETLPNGIRLIVQPETISDTVTVSGTIESSESLQAPRGKDGVGGILDDLLSYGTTSLDRLAYQKALDDIAAQISTGTSFSLHVLKPHFDRGMELLASDELHPALPSAAFAVVKAQAIGALTGEIRSPSYLTRLAVDKALFPANDPGLRRATPAGLGALTLADVSAFHDRVYRPDMTTIVVIGNVTPAEAKATVVKYFGDWHATGPKPSVDLPRIPKNSAAAAVVPDASRVQDQTELIETVNVDRTSPDYYPLQLGDNVLGGGFYATRLYRDLRQKAGLVYNVSNTFQAGKTRSIYAVSYGSDPPNVSKAHALVVRDLRDMQTTNVTPGELAQAKAILLRKIPLAESSEDAVAGMLGGYALAGLPLDESYRSAVIYEGLTADQIRNAFAKDVRPSDFVQVVQGPDPG